MVVDKHYVYTAGAEDCRIAIWSVGDLSLIQEINLSSRESLLGVNLYHLDGKRAAETLEVTRITALRRPLSRWTTVQRASRSKGTSGLLFVAAVQRVRDSAYADGAGILMEWHLGDRLT